MKVHTLQIPEEGKFIEGEDPASALDINEPELSVVSPLSYALHVGLSEGGLFATGRIAAQFQMQCVSCLSPFVLPIEIPDFACQVELDGREEVDLTEALREDILLALPAHPHCDGSGTQVCSGHPKGAPQADLPPEDRPDVWGDLDRLKL